MLSTARFIVVACLLSGSLAAHAASDEELVTDRPDQTESSAIVPRGHYQFEIGATHTEEDEAGFEFENDSLPEVLLRIGLSERFELRVGLDGYQWDEVSLPGGSSFEDDGLGDSSLGFKVRLTREDGPRPEIALLAAATLPTGDDGFTSDEVDPSFRFTFSNTLTDRLSLGYNVGAAWSTETDAGGDEDQLARAEWTLALGIGTTDKLSFYVELFGDTGLSAHGAARTAVNGGLTYLLRRNVQFDTFAGIGLSDVAEDRFAGVGLSFRLPG